ncbi:KTSC domain-containing protein [Neolewinella antarctica]|uniref:KTSC domain-containing protein n=1 Tax=Neolewinella antarctica TaxID=442734 RepID=A0ABX0X8H7_9BACT|nr:KTSC domain-containing protein [Neolewinella antarctica]NJC25560.1 hypothetical protein [Neolewinella antarctica]
MALPVVLQKVKSTMLSEMGYLRSAETLFVRFRSNGALYAYFKVPAVHWQRMRAVNSVGRYVQKNIFKQYPAARISEGDKPETREAA